MQRIPYLDFGGEGPIVHFAHANSYPAGSYRQLLAPLLKQHRILAIEHRPLWPEHTVPPLRSTWSEIADDLIRFLDQHHLRNIPGIGHSMGAVVTLLAAARRPDLFSRIILLDPVFFPTRMALTTAVMPMFMKRRQPWIRKTLERPCFWPSRAEAYAFHRSKRVFSGIPDTVMRDYVQAATVQEANGVRLRYSPEWEARVYCSLPFVWASLAACKNPVFAVRGEHSNVLSEAVWRRWQLKHPEMSYAQLSGAGHLFPLERPGQTAKLIQKSLAV